MQDRFRSWNRKSASISRLVLGKGRGTLGTRKVCLLTLYPAECFYTYQGAPVGTSFPFLKLRNMVKDTFLFPEVFEPQPKLAEFSQDIVFRCPELPSR